MSMMKYIVVHYTLHHRTEFALLGLALIRL